jgi:hypothetical protein
MNVLGEARGPCGRFPKTLRRVGSASESRRGCRGSMDGQVLIGFENYVSCLIATNVNPLAASFILPTAQLLLRCSLAHIVSGPGQDT